MKRVKLMGNNETEVQLKVASKTELDLFTKPVEQNVILSAQDFEYRSDWALSDDGPIQFSLPVNRDHFSDMANAYLKVQLKVVRSDGTAMDDSDKMKVVPVAGFFDSLFSRILVSLGDVAIGSETANHPQLAYLRNLLNYGDDFKSGSLRDTIGFAEEFLVGDDDKVTFPVWRHDMIKQSRLVTMCSRLQNSFFNCSKLLLPQVPVRIRLDRNSAAFSLITDKAVTDTYKIAMQSVSLFIRKVKVAPHTVSMIEHRLASQEAVYPYMRTELRHFLIPAGSQSVKHPNVYNGTMPTRLLFAVCPSLGVSGSSFHNNPFIFNGRDLKINYVQFFVDNVPTAFTAFTPDFENNDYVMSYIGLLRALRLLGNTQAKCPVPYESFAGPSTIFGVDLSADMSNLTMPSDGSISVEVRFKENVKESLNGLVIAEFRSCVYIDRRICNFNVKYCRLCE